MVDTAPTPAQIHVVAGVNGAGKSSIVGATIRSKGGEYYNPDEAAREIITARRELSQTEANAAAWEQGRRLLQRATDQGLDFTFETTLGGNTIPALLAEAAKRGLEIRIFFVGLNSAETHIERVQQRVRAGGHDIPETVIRRRYRHSLINLVHLLPALTELRVYDNSADADPATGQTPTPVLVLHVHRGRIVGPTDLTSTPGWAKPIVARALELARGPSPKTLGQQRFREGEGAAPPVKPCECNYPNTSPADPGPLQPDNGRAFGAACITVSGDGGAAHQRVASQPGCADPAE